MNKNSVNRDSVKKDSIKKSSMKNSERKTSARKRDTIKESSIKESSIKEGLIKEKSIKGRFRKADLEEAEEKQRKREVEKLLSEQYRQEKSKKRTEAEQISQKQNSKRGMNYTAQGLLSHVKEYDNKKQKYPVKNILLIFRLKKVRRLSIVLIMPDKMHLQTAYAEVTFYPHRERYLQRQILHRTAPNPEVIHMAGCLHMQLGSAQTGNRALNLWIISSCFVPTLSFWRKYGMNCRIRKILVIQL